MVKLIDSNLIRASNISTDSNNEYWESMFKMKNINSDLVYVKDGQSETLGFMRMNYEINKTKINDNKIVIRKHNNEDRKIFLKKNNEKIFNKIMPMLGLDMKDFEDKITLGNIENIQVHLSNDGNIDYFDLSINNFSFKYSDKYRFDDLSADMYGSFRRAKVKINNLSINDNRKNLLKDISGELSYASKENQYILVVQILTMTRELSFLLHGSKTSKNPSIKISLQSRLNDITQTLNLSDEILDLEYMA